MRSSTRAGQHSKSVLNSNSALNSRDITLPTKVRLVKAMVFPAVTYGCERSEERRVGKEWKQCQTLFWGASKSLQMVTAAMKLKDACSLEGKL